MRYINYNAPLLNTIYYFELLPVKEYGKYIT